MLIQEKQRRMLDELGRPAPDGDLIGGKPGFLRQPVCEIVSAPIGIEVGAVEVPASALSSSIKVHQGFRATFASYFCKVETQ
jgi:hypothetical protein